jgi:DNA polymerase-3 subunit beta
MTFDVPRKEFFEAVSAAAAATSARTSLSILQQLKLEAVDGQVRVVGCDGEMWVERVVSCMVEEPGAICLQARLLVELISSLSDGDISFKHSEGRGLLISQGASEYRMVSVEAEDFPEPPIVQQGNVLTLPMGLLRSAVDSVIYAVSTDYHRAALTGVLFVYDGKTLTLVATDTHRLAVRKIVQDGIGSNLNAVVPEKALKAIKALPIPDDTSVAINFGLDRLAVEANGAKVTSQLLAGTYPNWERVVPAETTRTWSVEADQLMEKVKRTMILAKDNANRVRFKGEDGQILISARSDEKGEAKEEVAMVGSNGSIEIAFNGKFVQDALAPIDGVGVRIEMTESSRPALFRSAEDDSSGYFCVIMPMNTV